MPLRYQTANEVGIRSDQILNPRGPGIQTQGPARDVNDHHPAQQQRHEQGLRSLQRPAQQPQYEDSRLRDGGNGLFMYPQAGDYPADRDSRFVVGPRNIMSIPYGPVGPPSMHHRLSDNRNYYVDGGPPHVQQEQQRRQQQDPW